MEAHARYSDPETSTAAAASVRDLSETQEKVLSLFGNPETGIRFTRDELIDAWRRLWPADRTTDQSIRSRLAELVDMGELEPVDVVKNDRNRSVQVIARTAKPGTLF